MSAPSANFFPTLLYCTAFNIRFRLWNAAPRLKVSIFPQLMQRLMAEEKAPRTKEQIIEMLKTSGEKWAGFVEGLTDSFLGEQVAMPAMMNNPPKSRFEMILGVKEHEMHHRGQLMLIERIIGIVPHLTREMQARMAGACKSLRQI